MHNTKPQIDGQAALLRASLEWIKSLIQKVNFGTITDIAVTNRVMSKGPNFKVEYTRKPRSHTSSRAANAKDGDDVNGGAMRDFAQDIATLEGSWLVKIDVANGKPLKWYWVEAQP